MFSPAVPRGSISLQRRLAKFRLRTSPCSTTFYHHCSARGVKGSAVLSASFPLTSALQTWPAVVSHRNFYCSAAMASRIDGTAIAKDIREGLKAEIEKIQQSNPRFKPNLVIFQGTQSAQCLNEGRKSDKANIVRKMEVGNRSDSS